MSSVHHVYPRFLCRLAVAERCAEAPASSRGGPAGLSRSFSRLLLTLVTTATAACGRGAVEGEGDPSLRFEGSAPSLVALGDRVLTALVRGDVATLKALRLTEHEHNDVVWPELPASAPEVNFPVDFAWQNIETRNKRGLDRILPLYRDRSLTHQRTECRGATERFGTFEVRTDCWVIFADGTDPRLFEVQLFKDALVRGGGYKLFRYYDEEPRRLGVGASSGVAP